MAAVAAGMTMTAETAAAVTSRSALARDRNRPAGDPNRRPVPAKIPGLSPDLSRDLLTGTVLPAAVKRKGTDFCYLWIKKEGGTAYRSLPFCTHKQSQNDDSLTGGDGSAILDKERQKAYGLKIRRIREEKSALC